MTLNEYVKRYMRTRTAAFYVALGVSLLAVAAGVIACAGLSAYGTAWPALVCVIVGFMAFLVLSFAGQDNAGAAAMGVLTLAGFVCLLVGEYSHFFNTIQNQAMTGFNIASVDGLMLLIVCVVLYVVSAIALNVCAWLRLKKIAGAARAA